MRRGGGISQAGRSCALSGANVSKIPLEKPLRGEGEVMVLGVTRPQNSGGSRDIISATKHRAPH